MIGIVTTIAAAAMAPVGCWNWDAAVKKLSAAGTVRLRSVDVSVMEKTKSFQAKKNTRIAEVNTPGAASGTMTLRNAWNGVAPSTPAACSSSHGISRKNADSVQMAIGRAKIRSGVTSPGRVSERLVFLHMLNSGPSMEIGWNIAMANAAVSTSR